MVFLKNFIASAQEVLTAVGIENPDLDVRLLVQHVLGWSQTKLLLNLNHVLTESEVKDLNAAIERRAQREPVSRIIGRRGFWKSEFKITPQTLDPRPDSETLIESVLKFVKPAPSTILDLGTGSGCLLLSLLIEWPKASGVGVDISGEAVATAGENAQVLGLAPRAQFTATDWERFTPQNPFELIISNPPYIADSEIPGLAPEVSKYDPLRALAAGADGLDCYRSIARHYRKWLKPQGWALFEIGHTQANDVKSILAQAGMTVLHVIPDLAGSDRVIVARSP
ncbi:MAG: peptide chain release factor N(5)-glutamine methyltransferase [Alphaproteobacteria bacterium]|nr:MAG: peptide chain release factor N(5)-glutamine methyltransferase [Alphaproteobacteria bacterium]